jgi:hypothetical protein
MKEWLQVIKEFSTFFGKKLDNVGVELKGVSLVTIKGDQGEKGDKGEPGKNGNDGVDGNDSKVPGPKGDPGKDGKSGKDGKPGKNGADGARGLDGKNGKDGSPDTGKQIIEKINTEKGDLIKKEKVEGLADIESMARTAEANSQRGYGGDFVTEGTNISITSLAGVKTIALDIPVQTTAPADPVLNQLWIDNT